MANITSGDGVASATVVINQDADGIYAIMISAIQPSLGQIAVEIGNQRIWQGSSRTDEASG